MNQLAYIIEEIGAHFRAVMTVDLFNKRLRVDQYYGNIDKIVETAELAAEKHGCEKIIFKAKREEYISLLSKGFVCEAMVDRFFAGSDAFFFSKFYAHERRNSKFWVEEDQLLVQIEKGAARPEKPNPPFTIVTCTKEHAEQLSALYKHVFKVYPVPMDDPAYVAECMDKGSVFIAYLHEGRLVSAVCGDISKAEWNAEITDCATLPEYRQYGLMQRLISLLEKKLAEKHILCLYSIARAKSYGMNAAFKKLGYSYRGRLVNNCYIFEDLEDMNMWVKFL
ncbi:putative beta-lysine N-acetyltransferase [Bacillus sp. 1P06AnD]|uniref:putative beta-lysine N-acetyltransferase n=1 Tax=Bacillus sp. 1P06AnD TaxID=3132208 RepID=UPI0039A30A07